MDIRTMCLGVLTRGEASGYQIKKALAEGGSQFFLEASFGSIYPALNRLSEEGLLSVREEAQEKRPDRKMYSITPAGRSAFFTALMKPLPEDRHRSPFLFAMLFADLLPPGRASALMDNYIAQSEAKLASIESRRGNTFLPGERFALDLGHTIYTAMLEFLRARRGDLERESLQAAE